MRTSVLFLLVAVGCGSVSSGDRDGAANGDAADRADGRVGEPDGPAADAPVPPSVDARPPTQACAIQQAEHPGYTTIARDVALCGNKYTPDTIRRACAADWHVCSVSEWTARYPIRTYKTTPADPDLIGPTLGPLTTWGAAQDARCSANVWEASQPEEATPYVGSVCHLADDTPEALGGADYNPYNNGKFLLADDGATILQGLAANGQPNWGSWDVTFAATTEIDGFAVYCCSGSD